MTKVQNIIVKEDDDGIRIDRWFKRYYPDVSHISVEKALRKGQIRVEGKRIKANMRVKTGDEIRVPPLVKLPEDVIKKTKSIEKKHSKKDIDLIKKSVIYEDDNLIIINKPSGLSTQGGTNVSVSVDSLSKYLVPEGSKKPKLTHRLDKDTSGVLVLAKTSKAATAVTEAFRDKSTQKIYLAITMGLPPKLREGVINLPLIKSGHGGVERVFVDHKLGQKAKTLYRIIESLPNKMSLMALYPVTGRTHQLRVHMESIGTPILADGKYGGRDVFPSGFSNKMSLHAYQIELPHILGKKVKVSAELPLHMKENFDTLGLEIPKDIYF